MHRFLFSLIITALTTLPLATAYAAKLPVFVSIVPQQYFIERLAGDAVDVSVMVKPGASPATYEPKPRQMATLSNAAIYFAIGVPFEQAWLPRIAAANKNMKIVHMDKGLKKLPMAAHHHDAHDEEQGHQAHGAMHEEPDQHHADAHEKHHDAHDKKHKHDEHIAHDTHAAGTAHAEHDHHEHDSDHGHEDHGHEEHAAHHEKHDHEEHAGHQHEPHKVAHEDHHEHADHEAVHGLDPHVWLSPAFAKHMALTARKVLTRALPDHAAQIRLNYRTLEKEIDALDEEIFNLFTPIPQEKRIFMVFHPSWGYFAASYSLKQIPIEYEGKEPTPKALRALIEEAREENIRTLFVQPQFNLKSAQTIARQIKGSLVIADPLAYDWQQNLRDVANKLAASFQR